MAGYLTVHSAISANIAVPALATDGKPLRPNMDGQPRGQGIRASAAVLCIKYTGTGTLTLTTHRHYGYNPTLGIWMPLGGAETDAKRGGINAGFALGEVTGTDNFIYHTERVIGLAPCFTRYQIEVTLGGTPTAYSAVLFEEA